MLSINYIRENKEEAIERLAVKNFDAKNLITEILVFLKNLTGNHS